MTLCPWSGYAPATITFCEARLCAWVVEPSNAWSNLAYLVCGLVVLAQARRRAPLLLIGLAAILLGFGSFAFHATGTRIGELLDVSAMYLLSGLGVAFSWRRLQAMSNGAFVRLYVGLVALSVLLMIGLHNNGIVVFALQFALSIGADLYLYLAHPEARCASYRHQKWMGVSLLVAFALWNADKLSLLCDPSNHLVTGHAVWHVLTALGLYHFSRQQDQLIS